MSHHLLEGMIDKKDVASTPGHDLDSLYIVVGYTILRRLSAKAKEIKPAPPASTPQSTEQDVKRPDAAAVRNALIVASTKHFGQTDLKELENDRRIGGFFRWIGHRDLTQFISESMTYPFRELILSMGEEYSDGFAQNLLGGARSTTVSPTARRISLMQRLLKAEAAILAVPSKP